MDGKTYLATASIIGNLVVKPNKGVPKAKIATDAQACIRYLVDKGFWFSASSEDGQAKKRGHDRQVVED